MSVQPIPEDPDDEWDFSEWQEKMAASRPSGAFTLGLQNSEDAITIAVPGNKVRSAVQQLLGWSWADDGPPYRLHRECVNANHPIFNWLWASGVSGLWWAPTGNPDEEILDDDGNVTGYRPKVFTTDAVGYGPDYYAKYAMADLTVRFSPATWLSLKDDDPSWAAWVGQEWRRFTAYSTIHPNLNLVTTEGQNEESGLRFAEGGGAGPTPGPASAPFAGSLFTRQQNNTFTVVWKCVPQGYIAPPPVATDPTTFLMPKPVRLLRQLGTLNKSYFPNPDPAKGFRPGTLLFEALEVQRYIQPVRTDGFIGLPAYDVTFTFVEFDPLRDPAAVTSPAGTTPVKYGHHLRPWRDTRYWYYATKGGAGVSGTYGGQSVFEETEFFDLFRHYADTAFPLPPP